jgi:hypothetical protein
MTNVITTIEGEAEREIRPLFRAYKKTESERQKTTPELARSLVSWRDLYRQTHRGCQSDPA